MTAECTSTEYYRNIISGEKCFERRFDLLQLVGKLINNNWEVRSNPRNGRYVLRFHLGLILLLFSPSTCQVCLNFWQAFADASDCFTLFPFTKPAVPTARRFRNNRPIKFNADLSPTRFNNMFRSAKIDTLCSGGLPKKHLSDGYFRKVTEINN